MELTKEFIQEFFSRLILGETLTQICCDGTMPPLDQIFFWLASKDPQHREFQSLYENLRKFQAEIYLEEMIQIADERQDDFLFDKNQRKPNRLAYQRCKLRIDARKLMVSKLLSKAKYERLVEKKPQAPKETIQEPQAQHPTSSAIEQLINEVKTTKVYNSLPRHIRRKKEHSERKALKKALKSKEAIHSLTPEPI